MATKRPKEAYGKKLIYHYSAPVIFYLLFSLMAVAVFVLTFYLPYIHGAYDVNGQHFIKLGINLFSGQENTEINYYVKSITDAVFEGNGLASAIIRIYFYILMIDLGFMSIFAFILAIGCLVMILSGRLKAWRLPYRCIGWLFYLGFFFYGSIIGINIYAGMIKKVAYYDSLYAYIFLGTLFILMIITRIIYRKAFWNHVYVKNERRLNMYIEEYERENVVVDTTKPDDEVLTSTSTLPSSLTSTSTTPATKAKPKIVLTPAEDQTEKNFSSDNRKTLPRGIKHIGGHAFSQNTALEEADIPLGIEILGPGAFANCVNLKVVHIPESVKKIEYNCFFNCIRLERITYGGSREMWKRVKRGSNWLTAAGTKFVVCRDGALAVNPEK